MSGGLEVWHMKVIRLSALRTGRLYLPGNIPGTHYCYRLSRPQGHSETGRLMWIKNFNDTIWNRTRDLLACSTAPQPNAPRVTHNEQEHRLKRPAQTYCCAGHTATPSAAQLLYADLAVGERAIKWRLDITMTPVMFYDRVAVANYSSEQR